MITKWHCRAPILPINTTDIDISTNTVLEASRYGSIWLSSSYSYNMHVVQCFCPYSAFAIFMLMFLVYLKKMFLQNSTKVSFKTKNKQ